MKTNNIPSLKAHFLLATANLGNEMVVLIMHHDTDGAIGFCVNAPLSDEKLMPFLEQFPEYAAHYVLEGGPMNEKVPYFLTTPDLILDGFTPITEGLNFSNSPHNLHKFPAIFEQPEKWRLLLGYCGWNSGDLEHQITEGYWTYLQATPERVATMFDKHPEELWSALRPC